MKFHALNIFYVIFKYFLAYYWNSFNMKKNKLVNKFDYI